MKYITAKKDLIALAIIAASLAVAGCIVMSDDQSIDAAEATPEAKIGETKYPTLAQAYENANSGDTIELLKNVVLGKTLVITKNITLKGEFEITGAPTGDFPDKKGLIDIGKNVKFVLDGPTIDGADLYRGIVSDGADIEMKSGKITNCRTDRNGGGICGAGPTKFKMTDGEIIDNESDAANSNIQMQHTVDCFFGSSATVTIEGGKIGYMYCNAGDGPYSSKTTVKGTAVIDNVWLPYYMTDKQPMDKPYGAELTLESGATINSLKIGTSPNGKGNEYLEIKSPSPAFYKGGMEAKIGNTYYETLHLAYAAAQPGNTIELIRSIVLPEPLVIKKSITLSGAFTITPAENTAFINTDDRMAMLFIDNRPKTDNKPNNLKVTIAEITIDGDGKYRGITNRNGHLIMESGTVTNCYSAGTNNYGSGVCITDKGKFTMKGGIIKDNKSGSEDAYYKYNTDLWCGSETVSNINGGEIGWARVMAKAVTVEGNADWTVYSGGTIKMTGGTIGQLCLEGAYDASHEPRAFYSKLEYTDGTITTLMSSDISKKESGHPKLHEITGIQKTKKYYGGMCTVTFYVGSEEHAVKSGVQPHSRAVFEVDDPADTTDLFFRGWGISAEATETARLANIEILEDTAFYAIYGEAEAKIGDVRYATLQKAYDNAAEGATITLLRNVVLDTPLIIRKSLTLEGEFTITGMKNSNSFRQVSVPVGSGTKNVPTGVVFIGNYDNATSNGNNTDIKVTLNGLTIDGGGQYRALTNWHSTLTILDVKITNGYYPTHAAGLFNTHGAVTIMNGGEITGNMLAEASMDGIYLEMSKDVWVGSGAKMTVEGGVIGNCMANALSKGWDGNWHSNLIIKGGSFDNVYLEVSYSKELGKAQRAYLDYQGGTIATLWMAILDHENIEPRDYITIPEPPAGEYWGGAITVTWINGTEETVDKVICGASLVELATKNAPAKISADKGAYEFLGWNTDPSATDALDLADIDTKDNLELYAIFGDEIYAYVFTGDLTDVSATYQIDAENEQVWDGSEILVPIGSNFKLSLTTGHDRIMVQQNGVQQLHHESDITYLVNNVDGPCEFVIYGESDYVPEPGGDDYDPTPSGGPSAYRITITLDANGGEISPSLMSVDFGKTLSSVNLPMPKYDGMDFHGWYLDGSPLAPNHMFTKNVTLTAHWTETVEPEPSPIPEPSEDFEDGGDNSLIIIAAVAAVAVLLVASYAIYRYK